MILLLKFGDSDMIRNSIFAIIISLLLCSHLPAQRPQGFASLDTLNQNGTTGGYGGKIYTVTNETEFLSLLGSTAPLVIQVSNTIHIATMVNMTSNKTIVGLEMNGIITGGGLNLSGVSNIIIRNILFENSLDDAINVQESSHHIWIDHCDFTAAFDGLLDIKRGSDFITVSWNHFYNHHKTCLLGHDDNNAAQDSGKFHVTYHNNWFHGTETRHPRVRFSGLTHVYNNYYTNNTYGIASTMHAKVLVENNYFLNVGHPTLTVVGVSLPGLLVQRNNIYDNCIYAPQDSEVVPEPPYNYTLETAADIPNLVQNGAGRAGFVPPQWEVYNGSVLPEDNTPTFLPDNEVNPPDTAGWVINDADIPGNHLFKFINDSNTSRLIYGIGWNINASKGATIAFRIKPIDDSYYDRTFEVEFRDGTLRERLFVSPGGVIELDRADVTAPLFTDPRGWHTYRITYRNGTSLVYIDEQSNPLLNGTSASNDNTNDLRFGDGSDSNSYAFLMDWFIFDTTGAYAPGYSVIPDSLEVDSIVQEPQPWQVYDGSFLPNENIPSFLLDNEVNPPDTAGWIIVDPIVPGNKLFQFINDSATSRIMYGIDWNMNTVKGATIAFRVKPIDDAYYDRTFEVEFRDGALRERMFILPDGEVELDRADVKTTLDAHPEGWHTYRITYQNGTSTVYLDEQLTPFLNGSSSSSNSTNDLRWGDGSDSYTYGFLMDWLVFDTSGSYKPGDKELPDSLIIDSPGPVEKPWVVYNAHVLPNENIPPYAPDNETNPPAEYSWIENDPEIPGNSILKFVNAEANSKVMWGLDWSMMPGTGATIAFRVRPIDTSIYPRTFEVEFRDGILRERMFLLPDGIVELYRADTARTLPYSPNGWHTYRITYQNGISKIYIDENPVSFLYGTSSSTNAYNDVRFGDGSEVNAYGFYLDWFIYDVTGAFSPDESLIPDSLYVDEQVTAIARSSEYEGPKSFRLFQNYPNPFNPSTHIKFQLPRSGWVYLAIYNVLGQKIRTLVDAEMKSGVHIINFDAQNLSSGFYFYFLKTEYYSDIRKMLLMK